jgi:hypothetical protein
MMTGWHGVLTVIFLIKNIEGNNQKELAEHSKD